MSKSVYFLIIAISVALIGYLLFASDDYTPITEQQKQQLSKSFGKKFSKMRESQQNRTANSSKPKSHSQSQSQSMGSDNKKASGTTQAIIGVILKKENSTWFIKAKDSQKRINQISQEFEKYFLTELKFDDSQKPIFEHLPKGSKITSTSSMRYATFMLHGVEVSVINLPGKQDIFSNVKRWMGQVGLNDQSPISMKFSKDKNTIFVKMPK